MAKPLVTLHFHAEDPFGAVFTAAIASSAEDVIRGSASFADSDKACSGRVLPSLLRLANSLGVPVLLSLSNERLVRALADPGEHKALSDGVSRGRFLPTPAPAFGAELRLLAPFEVSDELRLNIDLWKMAMITPPFTAQTRTDQRVVLYDIDPAGALGLIRPVRGKEPMMLGVDLGSVVRSGDAKGALARLTAALENRKDFRLAAPTANPHGWADRMLADILSSGESYPNFDPERGGRFDVGQDGFSLELARLLAPTGACARTFAKNGNEIIDAGFDFAKLDPDIGRGLLLRRLARAGAPDGIPVIERTRASFMLATVLLDSLLSGDADLAGHIDPAAFPLAAEIKAVTAREIEQMTAAAADDEAAQQVVANAKKLQTKLSRLVPKKKDPAEPLERVKFTTSVRKLTVAALAVLEELRNPVGCGL